MKYGVLIDTSSENNIQKHGHASVQPALKQPIERGALNPSRAAQQRALDLGTKLQKFLGLS